MTILNVQDHGNENLMVDVSSAGGLIVIDGQSNNTALILNGSTNGFNYSRVLQTIRYVLTPNPPILGYMFSLGTPILLMIQTLCQGK